MARKRRRAPKYAGALAQPIYVDVEKQYPEATLKEMCQTRAAENMLLLFKHYKIDPSDEQSWEKLAFQLAFDHVPGLRLAHRPKVGPKPKWKAGLGDKLVRAVEDVKSRTGKRKEEDAIAKLKEESGAMWGRYTVKNLGARYREARARQKALASMHDALNEINEMIMATDAAPSAMPPPRGWHEMANRPTKIDARAKTSRRK
jgi:hypothetical protein